MSYKKTFVIMGIMVFMPFAFQGSSTKDNRQVSQQKKIIQRKPALKRALSLSPYLPCIKNTEIPIARNPLEAGKQAYIWPDDRDSLTVSLLDLTKNIMQNGDTLYLRAGTFDGPIYAVDFSKIGAPRKRIHIRGAGPLKTTVKGYIWAGKDSSIKDLTVDNTGAQSDKTSVEINPPGASLENVIIRGGRNGILIGNDRSGTDAPVRLECVEIRAITYNGIILGDEKGPKTPDTQIKNVRVSGTGNMGMEVFGDRPLIENLTLQHIGTGGLLISGSQAEVRNSTFNTVALYGIGVQGSTASISNVDIQNIGTADNGTGIILYQNSSGYYLTNNFFKSVRIGILIESQKGTLSENRFENIFFKDILYSK